jgi:flagellar biosynthesis protein
MKEIKKAVALKYEREKDNAPKVIAKGSGKVAEKIIEIAKEYGITIKEDKELVEMLSKLDIGEEIPAELYQVVAKIFAFVYSTKKGLK